MGRGLRLFAVILALAALAAPAALADGDPASDVLLGENVFYPYTPAVAPGIQKTLNAETAAASHSHFPIKVALIASPVDLGVIPGLFGKPQKYADFLDQEISFQGKQPLLVVMSTGFGTQGLGAAATSAVPSLPKPSGAQSDDLARAAITAVAKLAQAAGHPIQAVTGIPRASHTGSASNGATTIILALLAAAALATGAALLALRRRQAA